MISTSLDDWFRYEQPDGPTTTPGTGWSGVTASDTEASMAERDPLYWCTDPSYPCPTCGHRATPASMSREPDGWVVERERHGKWRRVSGGTMMDRADAEAEAAEWHGVGDAVRILPVYIGATPAEPSEALRNAITYLWEVRDCDNWAWAEIERAFGLVRQPTAPAMPYPEDRGRTHWPGCWRERGHHNCAVAEIERLTAASAPEEASDD